MADERPNGRDSVKVVRASALAAALGDPASGGRVSAVEFAAAGIRPTWIGMTTLAAGGCTGPHQERNPDARPTVEFLVVRSDSERIAVALDIESGAQRR